MGSGDEALQHQVQGLQGLVEEGLCREVEKVRQLLSPSRWDRGPRPATGPGGAGLLVLVVPVPAHFPGQAAHLRVHTMPRSSLMSPFGSWGGWDGAVWDPPRGTGFSVAKGSSLPVGLTSRAMPIGPVLRELYAGVLPQLNIRGCHPEMFSTLYRRASYLPFALVLANDAAGPDFRASHLRPPILLLGLLREGAGLPCIRAHGSRALGLWPRTPWVPWGTRFSSPSPLSLPENSSQGGGGHRLGENRSPLPGTGSRSLGKPV